MKTIRWFTLLPVIMPVLLSTMGVHEVRAQDPQCQAVGAFVAARAVLRDAGLMYRDALDQVRQWDAAHAVPEHVRQRHDVMLYQVYTDARSPEAWRRTLEGPCTEKAQQEAQQAAKDAATCAKPKADVTYCASVTRNRAELTDAEAYFGGVQRLITGMAGEQDHPMRTAPLNVEARRAAMQQAQEDTEWQAVYRWCGQQILKDYRPPSSIYVAGSPEQQQFIRVATQCTHDVIRQRRAMGITP